MACPVVTTGSRFLAGTLNHLDCQAQALGSFGFQALAAPGSPAMLALTGLLTLFIALFAIRLLLGESAEPRDAVNGILKIGIVLTLAASWPAYRILAYDLVLRGPAEVAGAMIPSTLPATGSGFTNRLQNIDTGIASLTLAGTGRQTGSLALEQRQDGAFRAIAMQDDTAFGWARTLYLASVIGPLAILRVGGGLLLALAPLISGLLLFDFARGVFAGWLRGLVMVALGSLGTSVLLAVQVALTEPWLVDALRKRSLGYATPSAPTELLALTLAFALASAGLLILLGKVAFQNGWSFRVEPAPVKLADRRSASAPRQPARPIELTAQARALTVSGGVSNLIRHEEARRGIPGLVLGARRPEVLTPGGSGSDARIGSSWRRTSQRTTAAQTRRDSLA